MSKDKRIVYAVYSNKCGHSHYYELKFDPLIGTRLVEREFDNGARIEMFYVDEVAELRPPTNPKPPKGSGGQDG